MVAVMHVFAGLKKGRVIKMNEVCARFNNILLLHIKYIHVEEKVLISNYLAVVDLMELIEYGVRISRRNRWHPSSVKIGISAMKCGDVLCRLITYLSGKDGGVSLKRVTGDV